MAENVNNAYAEVTEIVFQNNRFPLNGASVDDVLALLNVPANAELEVVGAALLITEKSGTKGAGEVNQDLIAQLAETFGAENIKGARVALEARDAEIAEAKRAEKEREVEGALEGTGLEFTYDQLVALQKALDLIKR